MIPAANRLCRAHPLIRSRAMRYLPLLLLLPGLVGCVPGGVGSEATALAAGPATCPSNPDSVRAALTDTAYARAVALTDPERLAWMWFLGWNAPLDSAGLRLWEEGLRPTGTVFLPDGSEPAPWGRESAPPAPVVREALAMGLDTAAAFHDLDSELQVDGLTLEDAFGRNVRYEIRMSRAAFEHVVERGLYNVNGQDEAARRGEPVSFPADAFEVKTSWIWVGGDTTRLAELREVYLVANAWYEIVDEDGRPTGRYRVGRAALTGMHIVSRALPDWVWTTFDNPADTVYTRARPHLARSARAEALNAACRALLEERGSVLANYRAVGAQTAYTGGSGEPTLLANPQIETAFQEASSCITCHALAAYSPEEGYFDLVRSGGGNLTYYTGEPPDVQGRGYTSLDFAWSLKRAHWRRGSGEAGARGGADGDGRGGEAGVPGLHR